MEELSKPNEQGIAWAMARMVAGMVQLLQACARPKKRDMAGGMDTKANTVLYLVEMA